MRYTYRARRAPQEVLDGVVAAASRTEAVGLLARQGLYPIVVEETSSGAKAADGRRRPRWPPKGRQIARSMRILFARQLADLFGADVPLAEALRLVAQDPAYGSFRPRLAALGQAVNDGQPLSRALAAQPWWGSLRSQVDLAMLRAGEASGTLAETMQQIAAMMEHDEEIRARVWAGLAYPMLVIVVGALALVVLLGIVVPRLEGFLSLDMMGDRPLPGPTRALMAASRLLRRGWWVGAMLAATVVAVGARHRAALQGGWLRLQSRLPLVGPLATQAQVARLARTVGTLLARGVPLIEALAVSEGVVRDPRLRREVAAMRHEVADGTPFSQSLRRRAGFFGRFIGSMVAVGEERGRLDDSLLRVAAACERQTERAMQAALALLEPALILGLGVLVGFVAVALLLPIVEMSLSVR